MSNRRYIAIDRNSGFVWGEAWVPDGAFRAALGEIHATAGGSTADAFEEISKNDQSDATAYDLYSTTEDAPVIEDGQDKHTIKAVQALRHEGLYKVIKARD